MLVLIQQKLAVSRGKVRRDIWGSLTTGSVACSLAPWGLMSGIRPRSSVSAPRRQFLAPLRGPQACFLWGLGLLGILINSLVGLMDYQAVSRQRAWGVGNRLLPINLPVASLLAASMAPGLRAGNGALVTFSPPSRWF